MEKVAEGWSNLRAGRSINRVNYKDSVPITMVTLGAGNKLL